MRFLPIYLSALLLSACVTAGGAKHFKEGERLRAEGDFSGADRAYRDALSAEPGNAKYQERLDTLKEQIDLEVERLKSEAKGKEKSGDWAGASATYQRALAMKPGDQDLEARKELSAAKAKNLDPDAWYTEVSRISSKLSGNKIVERSLAGARANAYQYHLNLAAKMLEAGDGSAAFRSFERAKEIDPTTPGWKADQYDEARALDLMAQADLRLMAGDAVEAHDLYERAYQLKPLPEIKKKLADSKARASAILKKLDIARAKASQGKYAEALRHYDELGGMKGVPASVSEEAMKVRAELARSSALEAERAADRGDLKRAKPALLDALRVAELGAGPTESVKLAIDQTNNEEPGKALTTVESSGAPLDHPVIKAARAFARAGAKSALSRAQSLAKKDASKALQVLADLGPFEQEIPEIAVLKQSLRKDAFGGMLDDALGAAKRGEDKEASSLLLAALRASKAPEAMRAPAEEGCLYIGQGKFIDAEKAFNQALVAAPRSTLAQRGVDIARLRKRAAEKEAVDAIRSNKGDLERHVALLEASRQSEPGNAASAEAAKAIVSRLESSASSMDDVAVASQITFAARLSEIPVAARESLDQGGGALAQGQYADAETAFKKAESAAPNAKLASLGKSLARSRLLSALKSGVKEGTGEESSARSLAKLLKADPDNKDARAAVQALLDKAEKSGKEGNESEAARYLGLVVVATEPAPGVKLALDKGNAALGEGNMIEAEKLYADALDLEGDNAAAKLGLSLAKSARVASLRDAVSKAKTGEGVVQAQEALKKSLELDPNSQEARAAFAELLDGAKANGSEGKDREAAQLLDTANVVSKPETVRKAIGDANALLAAGKHEEAEKAYEKVLKSGQSKVAETGKGIARDRRVQVLLAGVAELKTGADLDRGAKATNALLALDATNTEARAAIDAAFARADEAADRGDEKAAAKELRACDIALGSTGGVPKAIADLERAKFDEAEAGFAKLSGEVASHGLELTKRRRMATLKQGMSGEGETAAKSIREVLTVDPSNKEAQAAFARMLENAKNAAKKGDDRGAASSLESAIAASGAAEDLAATLKVGLTHLSEGRYAEAEVGFSTALEISKDSKVAITGRDIARDRRKAAEKTASDAINKGGDPLKPAQVLQASLIVEPSSRAAADALTKLLARAKKSASKNDMADAARSLDAAAMLESLPAVVLAKISSANMALGGGEFGEAERAFEEALNPPEEEAPKKPSQVASIGKSMARERRLAQLREDLAKAQKEKDSLRSSDLVRQILEIDPNDKNAKTLAKRVSGDVAGARLEAARTQKGFGKYGVAHLYLSRVLALDPEHKEAKEEMASVEEALKESKDLIVKVQPVERGKAVSACKELEGDLRDALMTMASEREDLGLYVLGKSYTERVDRGDKDAPKVSGGLHVTINSCTSGSSTGKVGLAWTLKTPEKGKNISEGKADADLPAGLIPREEQDPAGKNVRKALAKRAATAVITKLEDARGAIDGWMMIAAEHAMAQKDAALTAEIYAKMKLVASREIDPKRAEAIEKYLDAEFK